MDEQQWRTQDASLDTQEAQVAVSERSLNAQVNQSIVKSKRKQLYLWTGLAAMFIISLGVSLLWLKQQADQKRQIAGANSVVIQEINNIDLANAAAGVELNNGDSVVVNGQLQVNQDITLKPSSQPGGPRLGQLYFDQQTLEIRYFNGDSFVSLASQIDVNDLLASISTLQGQIDSLLASVNLLSNGIGSVVSLQGKSGVLTLSGTNGLSITVGGNNISINLPQNLTTIGSPQFAGLTLTVPLGISSGGTGQNSFANNGVVVTDGSGNLSALTTGVAGQCVLSTAGAPTFGACSTGSVVSLNGLVGALTILNASGSGSNITIDNAVADGATKGIAAFNSTNFTAAAGVINTIQNINSTATPTFAGLTITNLLTVVSGGSTFSDTVNSATALRVLNSSSNPVLTVDTTNQSGNLVTNGTFEADTLGVEPVGWDPKNTPISVLASNTVARNGSQSMAVNIDGAGGAGQGAEFPVSLSALTSYNLAFWLRSSSGTLTDVYIGYRSGGVDVGVCTSTTNVLSTSWTQLTCSFTTGAAPSGTSIFVKKIAAAAVTIYADDVELYNVSGAKLVLGNSTNGILGQLQFASNAGGSVTFQTSPGASAVQNFIIGIPLESGTLCTDNINSACSITGDLKYLNKNKIDVSSASVGAAGTLYSFTNSNAGDTGRVLALQNGNNRGAALYLANTVDAVTYPDSVLLQVINNSSNRLRIFSGGEVGIDTSSLAPSDDPTFGDIAFGGGAGVIRTINPLQSTAVNANGATLQISGGIGSGTGTGGALTLYGGAAETSGVGGQVSIIGGTGAAAVNGSILLNGYISTVRPSEDHSAIFRVQNSAASNNILNVDSTAGANRFTIRGANETFSDQSEALVVKTAAGATTFNVDNSANQITLNHDTIINDELNIVATASNTLLVENGSGEDILRVDTTAEDIHIGSTNLDGTINIETNAGQTINIGALSDARTINIGTPAGAAQTINLGSSNAASTLSLTGGGGITLASNLSVSSGVDISFAGGVSNFDQSASSGTFDTGTGSVTINGSTTFANGVDVLFSGGISNFDQSASTGTFSTGTGTVTINGGTSITSGVDITFVGGVSNFDQSSSSGTFSTGTGAVTINGGTTFASGVDVLFSGGVSNFDQSASSGTFSTGTGTVTVNGGTMITSGVDITFAGGVSNFDQSLSTGTFATGSGSVSLNGDVSVASGKTLTVVGVGATTLGGTLDVTGVTTLAGNLAANGNTTIGNAASDRLTFTAQILGATPLVFQGATDDGFTSSLAFVDPTANHTFNFPDVGVGASDTVCLLTAANCAGAGGGVTTPGGVSGNFAIFTAAQVIDDSTLSEAAGVLTASGSLVVQGAAGVTLGVASTTAGKAVLYNATNANSVTLQSGVSTANIVLTLPTDDGTGTQCLKTDGSGVLSFANCVGGGGGGSGVTDLNTFVDSVSIVGTANQVNVANSLNVITLSTPQSIATTSDVTFDTLTANGGIVVSGATSSINASSNFATNINTGTSTGAVTIGNSAAGAFAVQSASTIALTAGTTYALSSSNLNVSTAGVITLAGSQTADITTATGASVTNITIKPGTPTDGAGGNLTLQATNGVGTNRTGGDLSLTAGNSTGSGDSGDISLTAGNGGSAVGGTISITGGTGGINSAGGGITLTAGTANGTGDGGLLLLQGGMASPTSGSDGGGVTVQSSDGTSPATGDGGNGGTVSILGGNGGTSLDAFGIGGYASDITIQAGNGGDAGVLGTSGNGGNIILSGGAVGGGIPLINGINGGVIVQNQGESGSAFAVRNINGDQLINISEGDTSGTDAFIYDPGFENDFTTQWVGKGSGSVSTTQMAYQGIQAMQVDTTAASNDGAEIQTTVALTTSTTYTLTLHAFGDITTSNFTMGWTEDGTDTNCLAATLLSTSGWKRFTCTFTTGGSYTTTKIYVKQTHATAHTFYIDSIQLTQTAQLAYQISSVGVVELDAVIKSPLLIQNEIDSDTALEVMDASATSILRVVTDRYNSGDKGIVVKNGIGLGSSAALSNNSNIWINHSFSAAQSSNCGFGCYGIVSTVSGDDPTGTFGIYALQGSSNGGASSTTFTHGVGLYIGPGNKNNATFTNNYGVWVANQVKGTTNYGFKYDGGAQTAATTNYGLNLGRLTTAGTANYGAYIGGATGATTNYALWVDNDESRFDGDILFNGVTTDITTTTNEDLTLWPNGTGDLLLKSGDLVQVQNSSGAAIASFNTSASATAVTTLSGALTANTAQSGVLINTSFTPTAEASVNHIGADIAPTFPATSTNFDNNTFIGIRGIPVYTAGSGRLGNAVGGRFSVSNTNTRQLTNGYGIQVTTFNDPNDQISAQSGIAVQSLDTAAADTVQLLLGTTTIATGDFAIYSSSSINSVIAGNVRIGGTTAPTVALDVTGAATLSGSLTLSTVVTDITTGANEDLTLLANGIGVIVLNDSVTTAGDIIPNADGTLDLGSSAAAFDELYLGDDSGLVLGLDSDATLGYDEATDNRTELTGTGASLYIEDRLSLGLSGLTLTDDGTANDSITPSTTYVRIGVDETANAGVPDLTISEASAKDGDLLIITNNEQDGSHDTFTITQSAGVVHLPGAANVTLGPNDTIMFIYMNDRWITISQSNN